MMGESDEGTQVKSGRGGYRPGSGRKPGSTLANGRVTPYKPAREKAELLSLWRTEVSRQFETLVQAQIQSAQGVTHMVARDAAGRWTTVTDPDVMVERLNAGEQAYRLSAVAPNATLIGQIMDRMFGQAKQTIDLDVSTEPSRLSDRELSASLGNLMKKLSPVSSPVVDVMPVEPETDERNEISPVDDGLAMACVSPDTSDTSETSGLRTVEEILAEARESAARREREDAWPDV
jgi:YD repeat-containing protein